MDSYFKEVSDLLDRIRGTCILSSFFLVMNQYSRHPEIRASHQIADLGVHIVFDATEIKESLRRVARIEKAKHPENARIAEEYLDKLLELENDINRFNRNKK